MAELDLEEFLRGILAVLAYRGKTRLQLVPGVVDVALAKTMELMEKQLGREKLEPRFRVSTAASGRLHQGVKRALRKFLDEELLQDAGETTPLVWNPHDAYLWLSVTTLPLNVLERAAKIFYAQHETARIRVNLHRIATRPRGTAASHPSPTGTRERSGKL